LEKEIVPDPSGAGDSEMSIWLAYPEEGEEGGGDDEVQKVLDEIEAADQSIDDLQDQLIIKLATLDRKLKLEEKETFVTDAGLGKGEESKIKEGSTLEPITDVPNAKWADILSLFERVRAETGLAPEQSLIKRARDVSNYLDKDWAYGTGGTPFGKLTLEKDENLASLTADEESVFGDISTALKEIDTKLKDVAEKLGEERTAGGGGEGAGKETPVSKDLKILKIDTVSKVVSSGKRLLVEHEIPGRSGEDGSVSVNLIQDMGRSPTIVNFQGLLTGNEPSRDDLRGRVDTLRNFYYQRKPLFFTSKIVHQIESPKVMIEHLSFEESTESPYAVGFSCTLREYHELDYEADTDAVPASLHAQIRHAIHYQTLLSATQYRLRFIGEGEDIPASEIKTRLIQKVVSEGKPVKSPGAMPEAEIIVTEEEEGEIEAKTPINLTVKTQNEAGDPIPELDYVLIKPNGEEVEGITGTDGTFLYEEMPQGRYVLKLKPLEEEEEEGGGAAAE